MHLAPRDWVVRDIESKHVHRYLNRWVFESRQQCVCGGGGAACGTIVMQSPGLSWCQNYKIPQDGSFYFHASGW